MRSATITTHLVAADHDRPHLIAPPEALACRSSRSPSSRARLIEIDRTSRTRPGVLPGTYDDMRGAPIYQHARGRRTG